MAGCSKIENKAAQLWSLAHNISWTWDPEAPGLFAALDQERWQRLNHNPVALLAELPAAELDAALGRVGDRAAGVYRRMREYLTVRSYNTWGARHCGPLQARPAVSFALEYGFHESLPFYSGGLGVLAGDQLKSASDLDVPLIGIGILYDHGYFRQRIGATLRQEVDHVRLDPDELPLEPAVQPDGEPVMVRIETANGVIVARVWTLAVGRRTLLLLDCDVEGNTSEDRELTSRLYGDGDRVRIRQELLLGVGGMRALEALQIPFGVLHLQEGHSAFALLEAARQRMAADGLSCQEAMRAVARQALFTTHTPVPAGHDWFTPALVEEHLQPLRQALGLSQEEFMDLGRQPGDKHFCMTVLALKLAGRASAVSRIHKDVTQKMWQKLWPGLTAAEVPIGYVTNGVHLPSWVAPQMGQLYDRHLGPQWREKCDDESTWQGIEQVGDAELWGARSELKQQMLDFVRERIVAQAVRRRDPEGFVKRLQNSLDPEILTIVFARRFTEYKRPELLFRDLPQLLQIVTDPDKPVQVVFAGKSHPQDKQGAALIHEIVKLTRHPELAGKVVYVEDYDMDVGRHLVQGADVWLNNPRRPEEACGTSGQKVVVNGGVNLSILDGWWADAWDLDNGQNGFAIGDAGESAEVHDGQDAGTLYKTLLEEVVPTYYRHDAQGLPRDWITFMKRSIRTLVWRFNSDRMCKDYVLSCYLPIVEANT